MRIPFTTEAEYRGQAPAGSFKDSATGEEIDYAPGLRFEVDMPDGDVDTWTFRQNRLDEAADFNVGELKKGDKVVLTGDATCGLKDKERSYVRVHSCQRAGAKSLRAAA
jgi:hypothetical protein